MTDLFETITAADSVTNCKRCAYKGRDVCRCSEEFANPELPQTASQAKWPFPGARREREAAERRFLERVAGASIEVEKAEVRLAEVGTPTCNANILALDLATKCGWAYATRSGKRRGGTERFSSGKNQQNGHRWLAFRQWLCDVSREADGFHVVYYEDVRRHVSNLSARAYCGYLAILEAWCAINNVPMVGVGVGTVKKAWTGKGNATKEEMIAEATRRRLSVMDDNHADALAILDYAVKQEQ